MNDPSQGPISPEMARQQQMMAALVSSFPSPPPSPPSPLFLCWLQWNPSFGAVVSVHSAGRAADNRWTNCGPIVTKRPSISSAKCGGWRSPQFERGRAGLGGVDSHFCDTGSGPHDNISGTWKEGLSEGGLAGQTILGWSREQTEAAEPWMAGMMEEEEEEEEEVEGEEGEEDNS